jgi:hypothetical protein
MRKRSADTIERGDTMKKLLLAATVVALAASLNPASARVLAHGKYTAAWASAPVPCALACSYWVQPSNQGVNNLSAACTEPFPPTSYVDHVVTAPRGARSLMVQISPTVDWDSFICAKPKVGNAGAMLASGGISSDCAGGVGTPGCVEISVASVKAGKSYIIRTYNFSDPADLPVEYWFKG